MVTNKFEYAMLSISIVECFQEWIQEYKKNPLFQASQEYGILSFSKRLE